MHYSKLQPYEKRSRILISLALSFYSFALIVFALVPFEEGPNVIVLPEILTATIGVFSIGSMWSRMLPKEHFMERYAYLTVAFNGLFAMLMYTIFSGDGWAIRLVVDSFLAVGVVGAFAAHLGDTGLEETVKNYSQFEDEV